MSFSHDDLSYRQYGQAPTQGTSPVGTVYANGTVQGPGDSMYGHSPTQGSNWPTQTPQNSARQQYIADIQASPAGVYTPSAGFQAGLMGLNRLAPQNMQAAAPPAAQSPAAPAPTNQLMPPIWQEEWQRVYDQMAALGHEDPQTVAYQTIAKYGLGPYAQQGPATGGVSGGGG